MVEMIITAAARDLRGVFCLDNNVIIKLTLNPTHIILL